MPTRRLTVALTAAALLLPVAPALAADCEQSSFNFGYDAQSVHSNWRVKKNAGCSQSIHLHGSNRLGFEAWRIARRASHGVAGIQPSIIGNRYAYQPNPGYLGGDSFSVSVKVLANPTPYVLTIDVDVDVVPSL
jgi:opacity protein-like surface antigen